MRKFYLTLVTLIACQLTWAQNENCSGATLLTNGTCVPGTPGLTQNIVGCTGNADDDVWYKFVASATSHSITVTGSPTFDPVLQFFSGTCSALISGGCVDNTLSGQSESMVASGLTIGTTYYIRVYHYAAGSGSGTFTICLNNPPTPPANDNCAAAINLPVNAGCVQTSGTTYGATTQTLYPACTGTANDDVWFMFTATNYTQTIQVTGSAAMDPVLEVFSGICGSLTSLYCIDNTFYAGTESVVATGLNPGSTYYFRVYDYYATAGSSFSVCVSGNSIITGSQPNDEPCNAIQLPAVTADCNYATYSNVGATLTSILTAPSPAGCIGGTGGFGASTKDVWFSITVPASGNLCITPEPNLSGAVITDAAMALYSGSCGNLSLIACSDDADGAGGSYNYPGTANDLLPYLNVTGLTPGATVYLRYWGWGGTSGSFGICVQAPTNDYCANALYICDINGYSASTSPAYTPDRPGTGTGQMYGNNETTTGVNQPDGINTGGIFGYYPYPGTTPGPYSSPALDVTIDNNSWIRFTAASPTIALRVSVYDCWENGTGNQGVQMQIFSGSNCNNFAPVSSFREGIGTYTVNATGLTMGNDYYLMVDGWGGNICNYSIQAIEGVAFPNITAVPGNLCPGQTSTLTAPAGAMGYTWAPTGENTQSIVVAPGTTMTYTCYVGGVCGYKQTLVKTVNLLAEPTVSINSGSAISTCGTQTITLTGSGASSYTWSTGSNMASTTVTPSVSTTYSLMGTAANGCTNTAVTSVTVNPVPITTVSGSGTITCVTNTINLNSTLAGANYTWTPPSGSSVSGINNQNTIGYGAGTYTLDVQSNAGCTYSTTLSVPIDTLHPSASATNGTITCITTSAVLTGGPAVGVAYNWSGPGISGSNTNSTVTVTTSGNYSLVTTNLSNGCTSSVTAVGIVISNIATPTVSAGSSQTITCSAPSVTLTGNATSGSDLSWNNGATTNTTVVGGAGIYTLTATNPISGCSAASTVQVLPSAGTPVGIVGAVTNSITCTNTVVPISITSTSSAISILWSGPGISGLNTTNTVNVTQGGTYTVNLTNTMSLCSQAYQVVVPTNTTPVTASANLNPSSGITCSTTTPTLNAMPAASTYSYSWSGPGIISGANTASPVVNTSGNYTVTITNTLTGCSGATGTATVAVPVNTIAPLAGISTSSLSITCTTPVPTVTVNTNVSNATYSWSPATSSGGNTATPGFTAAGNYTCTITDPANGCTTNTQINISNNTNMPVITIAPGASLTCSNHTIALTSTVNITTATYTWSGNGITSAINSSGISVNAAGVYSLSVTDTDNGCTSTATTSVGTNTTAPGLSASSSGTVLNCATTSLNLNATSANGTPVWTLPSGGSAANPLTAVTPGDYIATVTDANNGCITSQTITVNGNTIAPDANAGAAALMPCNTNAVTLAGSSSATNVVTYNWQGPHAGSITSGSNTATPLVNAPGVYSLTVTNTANGCTATATVNVMSNNVTAAFSADPMNGEAPLTVNMTNQSTGAVNYNWNFGNGQTSTLTDPAIVFTTAGTYSVILIASSATCADTAMKIITVDEGFTLEIPNVFTPNGDGANELFHIKMTGVKSAEGYIYNRWGQLLYSWDAKNVSWNGKARNGEDCPDGTYYYIIKVIDNKNKEHLTPGYVLIVR